MKQAEWKQEKLWVARDDQGRIIRVSEDHPSEWARKGKQKIKEWEKAHEDYFGRADNDTNTSG